MQLKTVHKGLGLFSVWEKLRIYEIRQIFSDTKFAIDLVQVHISNTFQHYNVTKYSKIILKNAEHQYTTIQSMRKPKIDALIIIQQSSTDFIDFWHLTCACLHFIFDICYLPFDWHLSFHILHLTFETWYYFTFYIILHFTYDFPHDILHLNFDIWHYLIFHIWHLTLKFLDMTLLNDIGTN